MIDTFFTLGGEYYVLTLFFIGILTGLVGSMGGPSGLIILPFMIFSGFAPAMALGTARLAATIPWILAVKKFKQSGEFRSKEFLYLATICVVAGSIGSYLILDVDEQLVYQIVGIALVIVAPLSFIKSDFGLITKDHGKIRKASGYALYFIAMLYGGFFGAGATIFAIFILVHFLGFKMLEAHSTHMGAWIIMSIFSCLIFIWHGQVDYFYAAIIVVSMSIGSIVGAKIALKKGNLWVKGLICIFAFLIGLKLIFDTLI